MGTTFTTLAIQVIVVETLDAGATGTGLVSGARWLPYLLFGLVAGVLVDRVRRRPLLVVADLLRGVLLLAVPLLALTGLLSVALLMVLMAVFGLMSLLGDAAAQSILPRLVPASALTRANARLDQSDAVAQTSGPALAGGLIALVGAPLAVLVDAISYLGSALLLARVRLAEPPTRRGSWRAVVPEALEGLRWVYRHRVIAPYAIATHAWFLCFSAAGAVLAPFALTTLGLGAFRFGVALAVGGVGALVGSLVAVRLGLRFGVGRVVIVSIAVTAGAWAVTALSGGPGWSAWVVLSLGQLTLGVSMGVSNANELGYRQAVTPDALQGRSNATMRSINRAMIVVGAPLGGIVADAIGFRPVLWTAAGGFVVVALVLLVSPYRSARMEDALP